MLKEPRFWKGMFWTTSCMVLLMYTGAAFHLWQMDSTGNLLALIETGFLLAVATVSYLLWEEEC